MSQTHVLYGAQATVQTFVGGIGGLRVTLKCIYFDFIEALQPGGLCVSPPALSTKWPVQYQLLKANVFEKCL